MPIVNRTASDLREEENLLANQEREEVAMRAKHEEELRALEEQSRRELEQEELAAVEALALKQQQVGLLGYCLVHFTIVHLHSRHSIFFILFWFH